MRHVEASEQRKNGKVSRQNVFARLGNLFGLLLCGRYGQTERPLKVTVKSNKKEANPGSERKKRHADESDEEELGCNELLDKYAKEDDSNDSSFGVSTSKINFESFLMKISFIE